LPRRLPEKRFERKERREHKFGTTRPFFSNISTRPAPVSKGEEHEVTVQAVGRKGDGIAKIQGFTVFIPEAKQGERMKVKILDVRANFALASRVK